MRRLYLVVALCMVALVSLTFAGAHRLTNAQDATPATDETVDAGMQSSATVQLQRPDGTEVGEVHLMDEEGQIRIELSNLQLEFAEYSIHFYEGGDCAQMGETIVTDQSTPVPGPVAVGTFIMIGTPTSIEATPAVGQDATVVAPGASLTDFEGAESVVLVLTKVGGIDVIACGSVEMMGADGGATPEVEEVIATSLAEELVEGTPDP